jgi:hypothetical protein
MLLGRGTAGAQEAFEQRCALSFPIRPAVQLTWSDAWSASGFLI